MSVRNRLKAAADWLQYGVKYVLLSVYGPAQQEASIDPIHQLKREHGREK